MAAAAHEPVPCVLAHVRRGATAHSSNLRHTARPAAEHTAPTKHAAARKPSSDVDRSGRADARAQHPATICLRASRGRGGALGFRPAPRPLVACPAYGRAVATAPTRGEGGEREADTRERGHVAVFVSPPRAGTSVDGQSQRVGLVGGEPGRAVNTRGWPHTHAGSGFEIGMGRRQGLSCAGGSQFGGAGQHRDSVSGTRVLTLTCRCGAWYWYYVIRRYTLLVSRYVIRSRVQRGTLRYTHPHRHTAVCTGRPQFAYTGFTFVFFALSFFVLVLRALSKTYRNSPIRIPIWFSRFSRTIHVVSCCTTRIL